MNILENKRVVLLSALFALGFAGLTYMGYDRSTQFSKTQAELKKIETKFQDYNEAELPPTAANRKAIVAACKEVDKISADMQAEIEKYASYCYGDGKVLSPVDFQNQVRSTIAEVQNKANAQGCTLSAPAMDLGMASFKNAAATEAEVPYRSFQLKAVQRVAEAIINSGAPALDKVYCAPLPEEATNARKGKGAAYFPLSFQVAFNAKRGVDTDGQTDEKLSTLPRVMNTLLADKDFFLIVTGVAVESSISLPARDAYQEPSAPAAKGDDLGGEEEAKPETTPAERIIAVRKTGSPDETVRVHLNIQVLYFNPSKGK
ncbi:MAG: Amuc_1100 family pilus-like protein [Akkermansia sp.]|nr:Amuc_1100 family pilus-like protein [Akkermansia sp.]